MLKNSQPELDVYRTTPIMTPYVISVILAF